MIQIEFNTIGHSTSVLERLYILKLFAGIMMHKKTSFLITGAILVATVVTVALYNVNIANAQSNNMTKSTTGPNMTKTMNMTAGGGNMTKLIAKLSGSNEVPPVTTAGSGIAIFQLSADGKSVDYQLNLTNIKGVIGAHIHSGKQGENGPVVAGLFNPSMNGPPTGAINGQLTKGTLTSSDLTGPLSGKQISALVNMLRSGAAYVNVHTTQNQNGEVRGQIL
jgi:hypothetical protein